MTTEIRGLKREDFKTRRAYRKAAFQLKNRMRWWAGKWCIQYLNGPDYNYMWPHVNKFRFAIIKKREGVKIPEGIVLTKEYYRGFVIEFTYLVPIKFRQP